MARLDIEVASAIHDLDQRQALLNEVRELVERNSTVLVESIAKAITQANKESFGEALQQLQDEEGEILRDERQARGK